MALIPREDSIYGVSESRYLGSLFMLKLIGQKMTERGANLSDTLSSFASMLINRLQADQLVPVWGTVGCCSTISIQISLVLRNCLFHSLQLLQSFFLSFFLSLFPFFFITEMTAPDEVENPRAGVAQFPK